MAQPLPQDRPVDFYWFSGTGNTLLATRAMTQTLRAAGLQVNLHRLERADPSAFDPSHSLGLAFPVAVSTTYPLVWRFCRALPRVEGTPVFIVDTLGGFSGAIVGPLRAIFRKKGYTAVGAREIQMPTNVFRRREPSDSDARMRAKGERLADRYAQDLLTGRANWGHVPLLPDIAYALMGSRFMWRLVAHDGRRMRLDGERCTGCGLCARLCPVQNINMVDDLPERDVRCEFCMRCAAFCPEQAWDPPYMPLIQYRAVSAADLLRDE